MAFNLLRTGLAAPSLPETLIDDIQIAVKPHVQIDDTIQNAVKPHVALDNGKGENSGSILNELDTNEMPDEHGQKHVGEISSNLPQARKDCDLVNALQIWKEHCEKKNAGSNRPKVDLVKVFLAWRDELKDEIVDRNHCGKKNVSEISSNPPQVGEDCDLLDVFIAWRNKLIAEKSPIIEHCGKKMEDLDFIKLFHECRHEIKKIELAKKTVMKLCGEKRVCDITSYPSEVLEDDNLLFELFEAWIDEFQIRYDTESTKISRFQFFKANVLLYSVQNKTPNLNYRLGRFADCGPGNIRVTGMY